MLRHLTHHGAQCIGLPGFMSIELNTPLVQCRHNSREIGISREQNTARVGNLSRLRQESVAIQIRHALIGDDHGHVGRVSQDVQRVQRIGGGKDIEFVFEKIGQRHQNFRLVIHQQDAAARLGSISIDVSHDVRPIVTGPVGVKRTGMDKIKRAPTPRPPFKFASSISMLPL